ncbi:MAG: glycosyltransferase [Candidatus Marsarchaeota archaeon]|nr:glycosyltransferase [Candidatus Marsarchaeota archaeon]
MRIALVGNDFEFKEKDGVSRYAYEIYSRLRGSNEVYTYTAKAASSFIGNAKMGLKRLAGVRISEDVDVVHLMYPNTIFPITKAPVAVTWHDAAIFSRHSTKNPASIDFYKYRGRVMPSLRNTKRADGIIAVSGKTLDEVRGFVDISGKKTAVIHEGIDDAFLSTTVYAGERKDFVYVGSVGYSHKNVPFLVSQFEKAVKDYGIKDELFIFTPTERGKISPELFGHKNVHVIIGEKTENIAKKLRTSVALLHFSKLEGFGLTILESMAIGTPVLILESADIPEEAAKYALKTSEAKAFEAIAELAKERHVLSQSAISYAKSFSWEKAADKTLEFYKSLK